MILDDTMFTAKWSLWFSNVASFYPSFPIIYIYIHDVHHVQSLFHNLPSIFSSCSHRFSHRFSLVMKISSHRFWTCPTLSRSIFWQRNAPWGSSRWSNSWPSWTCPRTATIPRGHIFCPRRDDVKTMPSDSWLVVSNMTFMGKSPFFNG